MRFKNCQSCAKNIGWVGLVVNLVLMLMNLLVGFVSGSQALIVGALYSLKDLVTSVFVLVGVAVARKPLDRQHPYGHGKIEFIMSFVFGLVLLVLSIYLLYHAVDMLVIRPRNKSPHLIAVWAAGVSAVAYTYLYYYVRCVAHQSNSPVIQMLARHHHSDATAAAIAGVGIIGAHALDMPWIDTTVAFLEAIDLTILGGKAIWEACNGLLDRSIAPPLRRRIQALAAGTDGVSEVRALKTRLMGHQICADMIIGVDADLTLDQAQLICLHVKKRIMAEIAHVGTLVVDAEVCQPDIDKNRQLRLQWQTAPAADTATTTAATTTVAEGFAE